MQGSELMIQGKRVAAGYVEEGVETVLTYSEPVYVRAWAVRAAQDIDNAPLVKRRDRHDDGSVSTTYYLELTEKQYKELGGR